MERVRGTAIGGALVLLVGLWARWRVLGSVQGTLNADEAYTGLQAMAIRDGDLPVVIRGAAYTGVVDAYVLAPIHAALGAHPVMLKVYSSPLRSSRTRSFGRPMIARDAVTTTGRWSSCLCFTSTATT